MTLIKSPPMPTLHPASAEESPPKAPPRMHAEGAAPEDAAPHGEGLDARAALLLPAQLLQPGETIILLLKPSPLYIVLSPLKQLTVVVLIAAFAGFIASKFGYNEWASRCLLAGLVVVAARLFWATLEWFNLTFVLTDRRVIRVAGVLRISIFQTTLQQIQHTDVLLSLRERLFNLGSIGFATAGTGVIEAIWRMVANPLEVHRTVVQTIRRYTGK